MPDTTKTILWIVGATVVAAVVIWLVASSARRRRDERRRDEAASLRVRAADRAPDVQDREDRASVTGRIAESARAEADATAAEAKAKGDEAARLEARAAEDEKAAAAARDERESLALEADRLDPDVRTDDAGHRLDEAGRRADDPAPERADDPAPERADDSTPVVADTLPAVSAGAGSSTATASAGGAGLGTAGTAAAAFTRDDDEPDLADAEDPFGTGVTTDEDHPSNGYDGGSETDSQDDTSDGTGAGRSDAAAGVDDADGSDAMDSTSDESTARTGGADDAVGDLDATIDIETQHDVEVPALDDRDEVVTGGGTPATDPGDHRGQPWSTSPGEPGPEEGNDLDTGDDALGGPIPEEELGMGDHQGGHDGDSAPAEDVTTGSAQAVQTGRRTSDFDEVTDGGYGVGSAATLHDGAQPLGHAVKGSHDGHTFLAPGDAGYDDAEPDVWFYDEDAARRAGFGRQGE